MYSTQSTGIRQSVKLNFHQHFGGTVPRLRIYFLVETPLESRNPIGKILGAPLSRMGSQIKIQYYVCSHIKKFTQRIMYIMHYNL